MRWAGPTSLKKLSLEVARFTVYLTVPLVVISICSDPNNMNRLLRKLNFVEYPPESKKILSGKEIMRQVEDREEKRRAARALAARSGIESHHLAASARSQQQQPATAAPAAASEGQKR